MALLRLGAVITEARGKLGGSAVQMHGGRCVLMNKAVKSPVASPLQRSQRYYLSFAQRCYRSLSAANKSAWQRFAVLYSSFLGYGSDYSLSGRELYISSALVQYPTYFVFFNGKPLITDVCNAGIFSIVINRAAQTMLVYYSGVISGYCRYAVYATAGQSAGHVARKSDYRRILASGYNPVQGYNIRNQWQSVWGQPLRANSIIHFKVVAFNTLNGLHHRPLFFSVRVT